MQSKINDILKDITILIVEDDENLKNTINISIKPYVFNIHLASNAKEAIAIFKSQKIDLIISDINMPDISGLSMATQIRQLDNNVPILFLTAYDSDENVEKALSLQSSGILKKPFNKRELILNLTFVVNKFKSDFARIDLGHGFIFDYITNDIFKDNKPISLTKKEQKLLNLLLKNQYGIVSFEMIESYVWMDNSCSLDAIRAFVYKLRKKLYPELILNAQGSGYRINIKR